MYELIDEDGRLLIVKYDQRRTVFSLVLRDREHALEILEALNNPGLDDAA